MRRVALKQEATSSRPERHPTALATAIPAETSSGCLVVLERGVSRPQIDHIRRVIAKHGQEDGIASGWEQKVVVSVLLDDVGGATKEILARMPGVHRVVAPPASPHPLVSADAAKGRSSVRIGDTEIGASIFTLVAGPFAIGTPAQSRGAWTAAVGAGATVLLASVGRDRRLRREPRHRALRKGDTHLQGAHPQHSRPLDRCGRAADATPSRGV